MKTKNTKKQNKNTKAKTKAQNKSTLKKQVQDKKTQKKLTNLYKAQNENRSQIAKQSQDYKESISTTIRKYFNNNYIKIISYKECYECNNGSLNYRVFVKSDKKLPKQFINSKYENDIKTMVIVNDKTRHIKCCIDLEPSENYKAF